jgi:site-specific DNA recombinase
MYQEGFTDDKGVHKAGMRSIAVQLNWEGITNKGSPWNYTAIRYFLMNPSNCGNLRWNYRKAGGDPTGKEIITENTHEAMISVEEFDYVQELIARREKIKRATSSVHPFSGVLKCGRCGYGMVGTTMKKHGVRKYYRCIKRSHYGQCDMPNITEESVVEAFFEAFDMDIGQFIEKPKEESPNNDYEKELSQVQKHKQKWQQMYMNDLITMDELRKEIEPYREREKWLMEQLKETHKKESPRWSRDEIADQLSNFVEVWNKIENQVAKKNFLYEVFESIVINTDAINPKGGPGKRVKVYVQDMSFRV